MTIALDLDGTLITCEPRQSAVLRAALVGCGIEADVDRVWELKRGGASTEKALLRLGLSPAEGQHVAAEWRRMIEEPAWLGLDSAQPGALAALHLMREAKARLWLVTARSRREWLPQQLARLRLSQWFQRVVVVTPHGAPAAKAAVLLEASAAAYFGDTESDFQAATIAEVPFYSVATGQRSATYLRSTGIKNLFSSLEEAWVALTRHNEKNHPNI